MEEKKEQVLPEKQIRANSHSEGKTKDKKMKGGLV